MASKPPEQLPPEPPPPEWGFDSWEEIARWLDEGANAPPPTASPTGEWFQVGDQAWSNVDPSKIKPGEKAVVFDPNLQPKIREWLQRRLRERHGPDTPAP